MVEAPALHLPAWLGDGAQSLAITSTPLDRLASQSLVSAGLGLWDRDVLVGLHSAGIDLPLGALVVLTPVVALGEPSPGPAVLRRARDRRRHFRLVVGSFVDLVVLGARRRHGHRRGPVCSLAGQPDWAAQRMVRSLLTARDSGASPWSALAALGQETGVTELVELSTTLQLAGTEGAADPAIFRNRAASLRRHEQADEESAANALTERFFVPAHFFSSAFSVRGLSGLHQDSRRLLMTVVMPSTSSILSQL